MQCLVCRKQLDSMRSDGQLSPSAATVFYSHGNYGSNVWDPGSDAAHLELFVCDGCLVERADCVLHVTPGARRQDNHYRIWDPRKDCG